MQATTSAVPLPAPGAPFQEITITQSGGETVSFRLPADARLFAVLPNEPEPEAPTARHLFLMK